MNVCPTCLLVPTEARSRKQIPSGWSYHVGAGNPTQVGWKSSQRSYKPEPIPFCFSVFDRVSLCSLLLPSLKLRGGDPMPGFFLSFCSLFPSPFFGVSLALPAHQGWGGRGSESWDEPLAGEELFTGRPEKNASSFALVTSLHIISEVSD